MRIPVSELKAGNKVKGTTIAELGNRNRPLDMIVYTKDGKHFILMANSSRGVMKLTGENLDGFTAHHQADRNRRRAVRDHRRPARACSSSISSTMRKALVLMGAGAFARPAHRAAAVTCVSNRS